MVFGSRLNNQDSRGKVRLPEFFGLWLTCFPKLPTWLSRFRCNIAPPQRYQTDVYTWIWCFQLPFATTFLHPFIVQVRFRLTFRRFQGANVGFRFAHWALCSKLGIVQGLLNIPFVGFNFFTFAGWNAHNLYNTCFGDVERGHENLKTRVICATAFQLRRFTQTLQSSHNMTRILSWFITRKLEVEFCSNLENTQMSNTSEMLVSKKQMNFDRSLDGSFWGIWDILSRASWQLWSLISQKLFRRGVDPNFSETANREEMPKIWRWTTYIYTVHHSTIYEKTILYDIWLYTYNYLYIYRYIYIYMYDTSILNVAIMPKKIPLNPPHLVQRRFMQHVIIHIYNIYIMYLT